MDDRVAISFGTDGWRATLDEFTVPRLRMVGQAVATLLDDDGVDGPVAIGYDAREHSQEFAQELARVLGANGRNVTIADRDCPTPVLAWTVASGPHAGGLMVTASHNPPDYNGVKFVPASGAPALPETTAAIEQRLAEPAPVPPSRYGSITEANLVPPYVDHALGFVDADLADRTIAYDGMHGSGRAVTPALLERAGATVDRRRCDRDPNFGGVPPEPSAENAAAIHDQVADGDADIGFINDGDADRLGVVTPGRGYLDPNVLLALLYDILRDTGSGDAVRTVSTSSLVDRVAAAAGQTVHETAVGFKWVAEAMADHDTLAGGEESGGYGVTAHLRNKDGVLLALLLADADAHRSLDERIDAILDEHGPVHQNRWSLDCPDERKEATLDRLADSLPEHVAGVAVERVNDVDGFKIALADGTWVLVRPSGTEPKLRLYAEARSEQRVGELLDAAEALVEPLVAAQS